MSLLVDLGYDGIWARVGRFADGERGSIIDVADGGESTILFTAGQLSSNIERIRGHSIAASARLSVGETELIKRLGLGSRFEMPVRTPQMGDAATLRFRQL